MLFSLPELNAAGQKLIRIPAEVDVPVTPRMLAVLDTQPMQRLRSISQLGLVSYVYPGAVHSRFEHSLGVYRLACLTLQHLISSDASFAEQITDDDLKTFLLSALLHDIGHWPYCHAIEDLRLPEFPTHESIARSLICDLPLSQIIETQWQVSPESVASLISSTRGADSQPTVLRNLLSGPVDIDKMDYLQRDSHHAGVPYGRNFDVGRLISSLCIGVDRQSIAITEKGKTAAEMMVFARYVMFSEVYWHHAVRSATAMLQRLVYALRDSFPTSEWLMQTEHDFSDRVLELSVAQPDTRRLALALWGRQRELYKRLAQFTLSDSPEVFAAIARRPYAELVRLSGLLAERLSRGLPTPLHPLDIIIDAPPVKLEVQFNVDVRQSASHNSTSAFVSLAEVSPVVRALATEQFDSFVKRVRIFIAPHRATDLHVTAADVTQMLLEICA